MKIPVAINKENYQGITKDRGSQGLILGEIRSNSRGHFVQGSHICSFILL